MRLIWCCAALGGLLANSSAMLRAQEGFRIEPRFDMAEVYDSNLLFGSEGGQADRITRVSPGFESTYQSPLVMFTGTYAMDAERFEEHPSLSGINAHRAHVGIRYKPALRSELAADAGLVRTLFPGELAVGTGLVLRPAPATQWNFRPSAARQLDERTRATMEYSMTDAAINSVMHFRTQTASVRLERHESERTTGTIAYTVERFDFSSSPASTSQLVSFGWKRSMTRHVALSVAAGPRSDNGRLAPDLRTAIDTALPRLDLSLSYVRTRTAMVGFVSAVDTESFNIVAGLKPWRGGEIRTTPGLYRIGSGHRVASIYRAGLELSERLSRTTALRAAYDTTLQDGNIAAVAPAAVAFSRRVISISFVRTVPADVQ